MPRHYSAWEEWFRENYQKLTADLMRVGASFDEAQEFAAEAVADLLRRATLVRNPYAYARKAAVNYLIKSRERSPLRVKERLIQTGQVASAYEDPGLTAWEDREWVTSLLSSLPPAQKEVMACVVDEFSPADVAKLLGKSPEAVRRALADARRRLKHDLAAAARAEAMAKAGSHSARR